ncbi:hypothetical protein MHBO_005117 [Bonamia ostreae]|uniref:3-beta hydroxysteroid dehydrogenase/isomerase domain-containing protein n=1 Tax=Bonamia ostreae TaxID=126728 RepID=A0ABV2AVY5_9EUKA
MNICRIRKEYFDRLKIGGRTVLVTGGCGFLGKNLCSLLLQLDVIVKIIDVKIHRFVEDEKIQYIEGDITNKGDIKKAIENCEIVFHVASPSSLTKNSDILKKGFKNKRQ